MKHGIVRQSPVFKDRVPIFIVAPRRNKEVAYGFIADGVNERCTKMDGIGREKQPTSWKPFPLKDRSIENGLPKRAKLDRVILAIRRNLLAEVVAVTAGVESEAAWVAESDLVRKKMTGINFNNSDLAFVSSSKPSFLGQQGSVIRNTVYAYGEKSVSYRWIHE
jgi:hypothetical protein